MRTPAERCNKGHKFTPATTITNARTGKRRCRICLDDWKASREPPPCSISGCPDPQVARKWCKNHYEHWRQHGVPVSPPEPGRYQDGENWLPVVGWEGLYEVSDRGRVWSIRSHRTLKYRLDGYGYPTVTLCEKRNSPGGRQIMVPVHRLMAAAFLRPRPDGQGVRHLDGSHQNDLIENLCYGTQQENMQDAMDHGTHKNAVAAAAVAVRPACVNGHEYKPGSFYFNAVGSKVCRQCDTEKAKRYHARRAAKAVTAT